MWKKTFIRLLFVMFVITIGMVVVAAATRKMQPVNTECSDTAENCPLKDDTKGGDFIILESLSRTVFSAVQY